MSEIHNFRAVTGGAAGGVAGGVAGGAAGGVAAGAAGGVAAGAAGGVAAGAAGGVARGATGLYQFLIGIGKGTAVGVSSVFHTALTSKEFDSDSSALKDSGKSIKLLRNHNASPLKEGTVYTAWVNLMNVRRKLSKRVHERNISRFLRLTMLQVYCGIFIPRSYRREAFSDLLEVFCKHPSNRAIGDFWEYTVGALDYRVTQLNEAFIWVLFSIQRSIAKTKTDFRILNH